MGENLADIFSRHLVHILCEAKKLHPFYFLNNFVKSHSILMIIGAQIPE